MAFGEPTARCGGPATGGCQPRKTADAKAMARNFMANLFSHRL